jgi:U2 small nuclear ribonucleoprotein A'
VFPLPAFLFYLFRRKEETIADSFFAIAQPHDAIDFTDNDIQVLGNFPLSPRITTLLLARNRVANIQPTAAAAVPNLRNLVLASNSLAELADVDALGTFTQLTHLVLADNPVTKKEVRFYVCVRRKKGY